MPALRKLVRAFVKPFKLDDVIAALQPFQLEGLIVAECRGYGRQKGHLELYEGSEYEIAFLPKVRIEFVCSAFELEPILGAIADAARTGRIGDGKILVSPIREL
ncbi:MAG: P-II family nitrogen regulator [Planctomycetota bacterium]